jgi:hypothetical protein
MLSYGDAPYMRVNLAARLLWLSGDKTAWDLSTTVHDAQVSITVTLRIERVTIASLNRLFKRTGLPCFKKGLKSERPCAHGASAISLEHMTYTF